MNTKKTTDPMNFKNYTSVIDLKNLCRIKNEKFNLEPGFSVLIARKMTYIPFSLVSNTVHESESKAEVHINRTSTSYNPTGSVLKIQGPAILERDIQVKDGNSVSTTVTQILEKDEIVYIDLNDKKFLKPIKFTSQQLQEDTIIDQILDLLFLYNQSIKSIPESLGFNMFTFVNNMLFPQLKGNRCEFQIIDKNRRYEKLSLGNTDSELIEKQKKKKNGSILKLYKEGFTLENFTGLEIKNERLSLPYDPVKIKDWFIDNLQVI